MMITEKMRARWDLLRDNIKNGKNYRTLRKRAKRDWYVDIGELDGNDIKFDIDKLMKVNRISINGKIVGEFTFAETALLYRFLKKCVYHR